MAITRPADKREDGFELRKILAVAAVPDGAEQPKAPCMGVYYSDSNGTIPRKAQFRRRSFR